MMDEKCLMVGKVTDADLLDHFDRQLKNHKHYMSRQTDPKAKELRRQVDFRLKHFAGELNSLALGPMDCWS